MLPLTHVSAWIMASVLLVATVLYLSLAPLSVPVYLPKHIDKFEHAVAYACLTVWFTGLVPRPRYARVALALAALGLAIELLQDAMPFGRQGDPRDLVVNVVGIGAGLVLAMRITGGWAARAEAWISRS